MVDYQDIDGNTKGQDYTPLVTRRPRVFSCIHAWVVDEIYCPPCVITGVGRFPELLSTTVSLSTPIQVSNSPLTLRRAALPRPFKRIPLGEKPRGRNARLSKDKYRDLQHVFSFKAS